MRRKRVLHLSTAHSAYDPRIVRKQCPALADRYEVWCALPHADPSVAPGVRFIRLPRFRRVLWRLLISSPYLLLRAAWLRPAIVHVYMPDLLPLAFVLRVLGCRIVYEVQENLRRKLAIKRINRGRLLRWGYRWLDAAARRHFHLIFTEHAYLETYRTLTHTAAVVYNYPDLPFYEPFRNRPAIPTDLVYVGGISFERAIDTLITALALLHQTHPATRLHLFGPVYFPEKELEGIPGYAAVRNHLTFYGYTDQAAALPVVARAAAGLALLKPVGDYPESYPTKVFEYMALGVPVITSAFPLYQDVVERPGGGFCIDPTDARTLADRLRFLLDHPAEAQQMGQRGRRAVQRHFTWETERRKLLDFYQHILL